MTMSGTSFRVDPHSIVVVGSIRAAVTQTSDMAPALSKEFLDIQANKRVWIHSETRT